MAIPTIDWCSQNTLAILLSRLYSLLSRLNNVLVPVIVRREYSEIIHIKG